MTYNIQKIGELIKKERMEHHMSLEYIAEKCDIKQYQTVSSWEKGNTTPSLKQLFKLCEIFNCELGYLLGEEGYENKTRTKTDIHKEIGLSIDAIDLLQRMNRCNFSEKLSDRKDYNLKLRKKRCKQFCDLFSLFISDFAIREIIENYGNNVNRIKSKGLYENEELIFYDEENALEFYNFQLQQQIFLFVKNYMEKIEEEE